MEIPNSDKETEEREERDLLGASQHIVQPNGGIEPPISTAHFIDCILTQLNATITIDTQQQHAGHSQNPLSTFSTSQKTSQVKSLMLTLHCLFPNELLLALDVLDRGLVKRLVNLQDDQDVQDVQENSENEDVSMTGTGTGTESSSNPAPSSQMRKTSEKEAIFLVISASASTDSTTRQEDKDKGYEVRLQAWNCTCPTFALCAFRDLHLHSDSDSDSDSDHDYDLVPVPDPRSKSRSESDDALHDYRFGGTLTRGSTSLSLPVCKHLLACMLLVRCPRLVGTGHSTLVTAEELAGWCAGWGG